ncbi:uncharacterized protein [Diadema antillarum]|uniref:uncharacterized protein n=1 Tax=Diadema antillarum TaxID=105358 RepID=UPI003A840B71
MPAASSKPAPQTTPSEGQDTLKLLVGVVEKKIRNLEKRKTKLDGYRATVSSGKALNKDQEEAVSHFEEVSASLEFAKELSKQFTSILNEATRAQKKEAKREKQQRHEQDLGRITEVLLLQDVLSHMGQDHVRADFLAGTNGAVRLEEDDLTHLDEFYKMVSPSREAEEDGEQEAENGDVSFDKKLELATNHLNSYVREEEKEVCSTTYKDLFHVVQRIHKCGYLDNIPPAPVEAQPAAAEETVAAAASFEPLEQSPPQQQQQQQQQVQEEEAFEENFEDGVQSFKDTALSDAPSESYYSGAGQEQMQPPPMQQAPVEVAQMSSSMQSSEPQQQTLAEMTAPSRVLDVPQAPEPIEMPPSSKQPPQPAPQQQRDVNEVLAPVLGNFNFVQDSVLDYDSPHMDPAVVAVSQPFIPSSTFTSSVQSSTNSAEISQTEQSSRDHQTLPDAQLSTEQAYQTQSRYDGSQQAYSSQGLADTTPYPGQTLEGTSSGFGAQTDLSSTSSVQVEYGSSQTSTSTKMNELPEFPSPPVDTQLLKQQDQSVLQSAILNQPSLSHTSSQYSSPGLGGTEGGYSSLGGGQLPSDTVSSGLSSQMAQGSSSSPLTITDPSQATIPLPGEQPSSDTSQGSIPPPKSQMNASAPPFQMTTTMRSSPQMQAMQSSPPGQVGPSQDLGGYQGALDQAQDYNHAGGRDGARTQSPTQDGKLGHSGVQANDSPVNSYGSYQPYYSRNGRGGAKPRGTNTNFRARGGAPFIRGGPPRYNSPQPPRGPGNFNTFVHREPFPPTRGPDMSYNPNARYGGFTQMQDPNYYQRRGMQRGGQRGGRGAPGGPRNQAPYRGSRGSFGKPSPQVSA